jgi:hypothetical protein
MEGFEHDRVDIRALIDLITQLHKLLMFKFVLELRSLGLIHDRLAPVLHGDRGSTKHTVQGFLRIIKHKAVLVSR